MAKSLFLCQAHLTLTISLSPPHWAWTWASHSTPCLSHLPSLSSVCGCPLSLASPDSFLREWSTELCPGSFLTLTHTHTPELLLTTKLYERDAEDAGDRKPQINRDATSCRSWVLLATGKKDPDAGKDGGQEEKGVTEDEMVGWHHWLSGHEFEQTLEDREGREAWHAAVCGVAKSWTQLSDWTTVFTQGYPAEGITEGRPLSPSNSSWQD